MTSNFEFENLLDQHRVEREEKECADYLNLLNTWYPIINEKLFNNELSPIDLDVEPEFYFYSDSLAQFCFPDYSQPFMLFSLNALKTARIDWVSGYIDDYYDAPTEDEFNEEIKEIILGTLIHEMIHQYAYEHKIKDHEFIDGTDVHTQAFKELATKNGLLVLSDFNGESNTHLSPVHPLLHELEYHDFMEPGLSEILSELDYYDEE